MEDSNRYYKSLCSSETLRSQSKGFFRDFSELVSKSAGNSWISKSFGETTKTDKERIEIIFTNPAVKKTVLETLSRVKHIYRNKDAYISKKKRFEAQKHNSTGNNEIALLYFSQAVLRAPPTKKVESIDDGYSLVLALIGRADVLTILGDYEFALNDLTLAANETISLTLRTKLENKRKDCLKLLKKSKESMLPYKNIKPKINTYLKPIPPDLTGGPGESSPRLSRLVEIRETENAGVHAVAAEKKINIGDTLAVEPPFVSCLLPEYYGTHCQNCFVRLRAPIGCPYCSSVAFCGKECRDIGMKTYHKYECKILALLIGSGMSILSILALRMVTEKGLDFCIRTYEKFCSTNKMSDGNKNDNTEMNLSKSAKRRLRKKKLNESLANEDCVKSDILNQNIRYDSKAYGLVTHDSSRSDFDFFERSLMSLFLLRCLQTVDFFKVPTSSFIDSLSNEELGVAVVLLRNLQLLQFNAHEISETRISHKHRFQGSKSVYIGVGLYIEIARFNHDCYPAVTRYFTGRDIVIRATRPLNPGETIAENYGPIFTKRSLEDRQRSLEGRYWFKCTCLACTENWPDFDNLINYKTRFRCTTTDCPGLLLTSLNSNRPVKCLICEKKINLKNRLEILKNCKVKYTKAFDLMEKEKPLDATTELIMALEEFHKIAYPPHRETHLAEIALAACMADSGNIWKPYR